MATNPTSRPAADVAPIAVTGVLHFSVPVDDMEKSIWFYTQVLGLTLAGTHPVQPMTFLKAGNDYVILCQSKFGPRHDNSFLHHAFTVPNMAEFERAKEVCRANGIAILYEEDRRQGYLLGPQFHVNDPYGNDIEINCFRGPGPGF